MSYKDCYWYFALQNFAQNLWHHAKWGKSIKILVEPNLLEDIYCLAQWTWTPRMDLISIFWQIFSWQILWNDWGASFHSEEPDLFLDSQLAITFSFLGRYSAVRMYPYCRRWSHISFANWIDFKFWKPLIFNRYAKATILPTWRWMALFFNVFENILYPVLWLKILRHLCGFSFPEETTYPLLRFHCTFPPSPLLSHLSVLIPLQMVELIPNHYTVTPLHTFVPTISVWFLSFCSK